MSSRLAFVLAAILIGGDLTSALSATDLGLTVNDRGTLLRHGRPYRGIGVNYYDAFVRCLRNAGDESYRQGFNQLGEHGIPFARFSAGSFFAGDVQQYLKDKDSYFRRLDGVVGAAERAHVGLIASLFWTLSAVSDAVGETRDRWADPQSKTRQLMRRYTQDVVSRYMNSPAIWGWEFSNDLSLPLDMPPGAVPPERALPYATFQSAALDFAKSVRSLDPHRILLTGNSVPRINAFHNSVPGRGGPDTEAQFARILLRDNPGPFSPICIHASPAVIGHYFADRQVSFQQLLETCLRIGETARKPIYLEEFIPLPNDPRVMRVINPKDYFSAELDAIENSKVPLASVWEYDRKTARDHFSLSFEDGNAYMLQMIADFDRTIHAAE